MNTNTRKLVSVVAIVGSILALNAFLVGVSSASEISRTNGSIILPAEDSDGADLRTVNGRIEVGQGIKVGNVKTVNGRISIGPEATAKDVKTTNGRISIEEGSATGNVRTTNGRINIDAAMVDGDVRTTNGKIDISDSTKIEGRVVSTNGGIDLRNSLVTKDIETSNGKIHLRNSEVQGDIIINERRGWSLFHFGHWDKPEVVIGPKSVVKGSIIAHQDIKLYIHEDASVGKIDGAEAKYFSGDRP